MTNFLPTALSKLPFSAPHNEYLPECIIRVWGHPMQRTVELQSWASLHEPFPRPIDASEGLWKGSKFYTKPKVRTLHPRLACFIQGRHSDSIYECRSWEARHPYKPQSASAVATFLFATSAKFLFGKSMYPSITYSTFSQIFLKDWVFLEHTRNQPWTLNVVLINCGGWELAWHLYTPLSDTETRMIFRDQSWKKD